MRYVTRNPFARFTILSERVQVGTVPPNGVPTRTCTECGGFRARYPRTLGAHTRPVFAWLYRFHVDNDQGPRQSGPLADGKLFCSRVCAESYTGQPFGA